MLDSQQHSGRNTLPSTQNNLSSGEQIAGVDRYLQLAATFDKTENVDLLSFHNFNGFNVITSLHSEV